MLVLQSIYACKSTSDMQTIIKAQPNPTIFFKCFLELGCKSMM